MKYGRIRNPENTIDRVFEVSDKPDTGYVECNITLMEKSQLEYVGRTMKRYPHLRACLRQCTDYPALEIVPGSQLYELEPGYIIIQPPVYETPPPSGPWG